MTVLREAPLDTLEDLANQWAIGHATWGGPLSTVTFDLEAEKPLIRLGDHEIAATKTGVSAIAHHLGVPPKFIERVMPDEKQWILSRRVERVEEQNVNIAYSEAGILEIYKSGQRRIEPGEIVESLGAVMPWKSLVRDAILTTDELRIDCFVPDGHEHRGGDKKVGDITAGGLTCGMDRKHNLAPWVQTFVYRLACTNGMVIPDSTMKFDSRGMDEMDVLASLRAEMRRGYDRVMNDIATYYDMRDQKVAKDHTGVLRRMALDAGLPERVVGAMENILPAEIDGNDDVSMFDIVNVITNQANNFDAGSSTFRNLQIAGGGMVNDHAERCSNCHQRVAV